MGAPEQFYQGHDQYPDTQSAALMFLDQYSRIAPTPAASEGTAFMQKGKSDKKSTRGGDLDKKKGKERRRRTPLSTCGAFIVIRLAIQLVFASMLTPMTTAAVHPVSRKILCQNKLNL